MTAPSVSIYIKKSPLLLVGHRFFQLRETAPLLSDGINHKDKSIFDKEV